MSPVPVKMKILTTCAGEDGGLDAQTESNINERVDSGMSGDTLTPMERTRDGVELVEIENEPQQDQSALHACVAPSAGTASV